MNTDNDTRLKKLRFRAWRRGFREADLILGPFADRYCRNFTAEEFDGFEALLDQDDHDVFAWIAGSREPPPEFNTASSIVSGLAAEMLMTPPLVETPVMPPIPPIVNPPVFAT